MTDNVQYQNNAQLNGWIPNDTIIETEQQTGGQHRQIVRSYLAGDHLDAFSRLRVSNPTGVFDSQFTYDLHPLLYEQVTAETGAAIAHSSSNGDAVMTFADTPTGGKAFMQTYEHFRYQPGKSQQIFITFNTQGGVANVVKFAGYSDGTNGIEFQMNGTTPQFVIYSNTDNGNQTLVQSSWDDPMDGTGASGITLDFSKEQILVIDFQALYVGRVRVGWDVNGEVKYCHEFNHANNTTEPYIATANLPVRVGMTCTGTVSTTMDFNCCSVISEGGQDDVSGYSFAAEGAGTAGNSARAHILSLRPNTTFNSIVNRVKFVLDNVDIIVTGNTPVYWELCIGQAISGTTTYTDVNATYSAFEYNTAGTISGTPAIVIASGYVPATAANKSASSAKIANRYPITLDVAGAVRSLGTLSLIATGLGATSAMRATFNWHEVR